MQDTRWKRKQKARTERKQNKAEQRKTEQRRNNDNTKKESITKQGKTKARQIIPCQSETRRAETKMKFAAVPLNVTRKASKTRTAQNKADKKRADANNDPKTAQKEAETKNTASTMGK